MPVDAAAIPVKNKAALNSNHDDSQSGYVWKAVWQTGAPTPNPVPSQALQHCHCNVSGPSRWGCLWILPANCYGDVGGEGAVFCETHL